MPPDFWPNGQKSLLPKKQEQLAQRDSSTVGANEEWVEYRPSGFPLHAHHVRVGVYRQGEVKVQ